MLGKIRHVSINVGARACCECDVRLSVSNLKVSDRARVRLRPKGNAKRVVLVRSHVSWMTQVNCRFVLWLRRSANWTKKIVNQAGSARKPESPRQKRGGESVITKMLSMIGHHYRNAIEFKVIKLWLLVNSMTKS